MALLYPVKSEITGLQTEATAFFWISVICKLSMTGSWNPKSIPYLKLLHRTL